MKFYIAMCVLANLLLQEFTASGTVNIETMTMKLSKRDVQPLALGKSVKSNVSLINCVEKCNRDSSCKSLTYNKETCSLYEKDYSEDERQLESAVGSMYYSIYEKQKESTTASPSTTTGLQFHVKAYMSKESISWAGDKKKCENKGGNLVSILNEDIQNQVVDAMKKLKVTKGSWIGLRGINKENEFQWLEGTILRGMKKGAKTKYPVQIWHPVNPNNSDMDTPVRILGSDFGKNAYTWSDELHDTKFESYVCEFNP